MELEEFINYLRDTPDVFDHHRRSITPSRNYGYSDEPRSSSGELRPPLSLSALEYADLEAGALGNVALHAMWAGTLPKRHTSHFLMTKKRDSLHHLRLGVELLFDAPECVGTRSYVENGDLTQEILSLSGYILKHAQDVHETEGMQPFLEYASKVRRASDQTIKRSFDAEDWITIKEAADMCSRSIETITSWIATGEIVVSVWEGDTLINAKSLQLYRMRHERVKSQPDYWGNKCKMNT